MQKSRILGLDFGTKRMGIALSDERRVIAQPHCVLKREGGKKDIEKILDIVRKYNVSKVVIGIPYRDDGNISLIGEMASKFGRLLEESMSVEVVFMDETLSSFMAEEALAGGGTGRKKKKAVIDKVAAAIILQDYLRKEGDEKNN